MKLHSKIYGDNSQDLIIIHGLFGMSDNWNSFGKRFSENFTVHLIDLRNHGKSPHSDEFNYQVMSDDVFEYMKDYDIQNPIILGHSLGGKVGMKIAFSNPDKISKLIIADIAPRRYNTDFVEKLLQTLYRLPLENFKKREEIDTILAGVYKDRGIRSFLMKNLYRNKKGVFNWRFNIDILLEKVNNIQEADFIKGICNVPTYFMKGGNSNYITTEDELIINQHFSDFEIVTIDETGHWLHVENPEKFYLEVLNCCFKKD